jgi:hypothetical protein
MERALGGCRKLRIEIRFGEVTAILGIDSLGSTTPGVNSGFYDDPQAKVGARPDPFCHSRRKKNFPVYPNRMIVW